MKIKAVRLHGKSDLRFDEIFLPDISEDEMLIKNITDSICMSTWKATIQGSDHRVVPKDIAENPVIMGHEFSGLVVKVGKNLREYFREGDACAIQPASHYVPALVPGYTSKTFGGDATYTIVPGCFVRDGYCIPYKGDTYYNASLVEPISCIVHALHMSYHNGPDNNSHAMGLKQGGSLAILAGCGPMGLGAVETAMAMENKPSHIVVTDIDDARVNRAKSLLHFRNGVTGEVVNTKGVEDVKAFLLEKNGGKGFDDILIMAPVKEVIETADAIAGEDCCLNFFAGPSRKDFYANVNFYPIHYNNKKIIGTSGGNMSDFMEALGYIGNNTINAAVLVTHIGGLNVAAETTLHLPDVPGAKKLIYCNKDLPLVAIEDFEEMGKTSALYAGLHTICSKYNLLWNREAEEFLLAHGKDL